MEGCTLCPRMCGADRENNTGFCGEYNRIRAARAALHMWEEPCISGSRGSGTVFFTGCVMRCVFCQNYSVSALGFGKEISVERLSDIFLELEQKGAHNINLVNPTHFVPQIIAALDLSRKKGMSLPAVYNSGGYERVETLKKLEGYVDIYLPDVKYFSDEYAVKLSSAPNYFKTAAAAVSEMIRQTGKPIFNGELLQKGVIVRHLVLPNLYKDSIEVIKQVGERFKGEILFSLMSQYTPFYKAKNIRGLNRRITTFEYQKALSAVIDAGLEGYSQEKSSAKEEYTPDFDLYGV